MTTADTPTPATTFLLFAVPAMEPGPQVIALPLTARTVTAVRAAAAIAAIAEEAGLPPVAVPVTQADLGWRRAHRDTLSRIVGDERTLALADLADDDMTALETFARADYRGVNPLRLDLSEARYFTDLAALGFHAPDETLASADATLALVVLSHGRLGIELRTPLECGTGVAVRAGAGAMYFWEVPELAGMPRVTRAGTPAATPPAARDVDAPIR